jgi:hypothetical protein
LHLLKYINFILPLNLRKYPFFNALDFESYALVLQKELKEKALALA